MRPEGLHSSSHLVCEVTGLVQAPALACALGLTAMASKRLAWKPYCLQLACGAGTLHQSRDAIVQNELSFTLESEPQWDEPALSARAVRSHLELLHYSISPGIVSKQSARMHASI